MNERAIEQAYASAREQYAAWGVDVDAALSTLQTLPLSLPCWQGDDVRGVESDEGLTGGGIAATGSYPGRARTPDELRLDLTTALRLIPGRHRVNLHAIYADYQGRKVSRDALAPEHFAGWVDWARQQGVGLDFNGTFFSHPLANKGFTLSSSDDSVRRFWVDHAVACRRIGAHFGRELGSACVVNVWIPDGHKDWPIDRAGPRERLLRSLDEIFAEKLDPGHVLDAVESKLFGIGSEAYVVGSHEFYLGYAASRGVLLCLDLGHFHPTESVADKLSAVLLWVKAVLLHVSRGLRWDSDHVVTFSDEVRAVAEEIVRGGYLPRVRLGLDYFDASINRVAAWCIGARALQKALLAALLEPTERLRQVEAAGDTTARLALLEELKTLPLGAVWDFWCLRCEVPVGARWLEEVRRYEREVLALRGAVGS
jgi:L-rhamnose isomerase